MQIENVARIRFASRGTAEQKRHSTVRRRVFRQIIVDAEAVAALIHEVLGDGNAGIGGQILKRRTVRRCRRHHDGIRHRAMVFQRFYYPRHRRSLLADSNVNTDAVLPLLINDGINGDGRFPRAAVADNELALTAPDGHQGVDGFDPRLEGLMNGLTIRNTRRPVLDGPIFLGFDGAFTVNGAP